MRIFLILACALIIGCSLFAKEFFADASYVGCDYYYRPSNLPPLHENGVIATYEYYGVENCEDAIYVYKLASNSDFNAQFFEDIYKKIFERSAKTDTEGGLISPDTFKDKHIGLYSYIFRRVENSDIYLVLKSEWHPFLPLRYIAKTNDNEISFYYGSKEKTSFTDEDFYFSISKMGRVLLFKRYQNNDLEADKVNYELMPYKLAQRTNQKISKEDIDFISSKEKRDLLKLGGACGNLKEVGGYINSISGIWECKSSDEKSDLNARKMSYVSLYLPRPSKKIKEGVFVFPNLCISGDPKNGKILIGFSSYSISLEGNSCACSSVFKTVDFSLKDLSEKPLSLKLECGDYKFEFGVSLKSFEIKEYRKDGENWVLQAVMKKAVGGGKGKDKE